MSSNTTIRSPRRGQSILAAAVLLAAASFSSALSQHQAGRSGGGSGQHPFAQPRQIQLPSAPARTSAPQSSSPHPYANQPVTPQSQHSNPTYAAGQTTPGQNNLGQPYAAQPYSGQPYGSQPGSNQPRAGANPQQHLGQWMSSHSSQPLDQQQRALEQEPGFHQLRPEVQQHMRDRLTQLNRMTPERRQLAIQRTEAMERLVPQQRIQVRSALGQLGTLPPERQRAVVRAFGTVRDMPETQRQMYLNSPQFRGQFNDQERDTLNNLVRVTPAAASAGLPGFVPRPNLQPPPPYAPPQF